MRITPSHHIAAGGGISKFWGVNRDWALLDTNTGLNYDNSCAEILKLSLISGFWRARFAAQNLL
ncbi:MAG TPA: hypothetical protein DEA22_06945 [Blastocatellia bacterium]|nr:hypothetical protein [Blastocatellia bacterium]